MGQGRVIGSMGRSRETVMNFPSGPRWMSAPREQGMEEVNAR